MSKAILSETELRESLKRCPAHSVDAAIEFQATRDFTLVPVIVEGIIERFVEPDIRDKVREGKGSMRLAEDLGIDSLLMVEIVILVEETLGIQIENEELRGLQTLQDLRDYLSEKLNGGAITQTNGTMAREQIEALMPYREPFLFLDQSHVDGDEATGRYSISGDEDFLQGHFKDEPIFPATLMMEALGQLACLWLIKSDHAGLRSIQDRSKALFVASNGVRCHRICRPGDGLELKVKLKRLHAPLAVFEGTIECDGEKTAVAEEITLAFGKQTSRNGH